MTTAAYTTLTRQNGLMAEMQTIANNIANANTTGYRAEGVIFAEYIQSNDRGSVSMASAEVRNTNFAQGALSQTGGQFDLAIEGEGFFLVETPDGPRLTRAGTFSPNADGELVTMDGYPVLDAGQTPVFVPTGSGNVGIAADGTISAGGTPVGQIGLFQPIDPLSLRREDGVRFSADGFEPASDASLIQGFVEGSNVNPVMQIARMIEVQRAYELGQSFADNENQRLRDAIDVLGK